MNHLAKETSPYLRQHVNNPVNWYPWGDEAFDLAARENKPVLISIGYSSCHWCHVMAHESFEDQETAGLMNALYINVKVDREEYPDVDHMYMDAIQAMTGSGGWPLNVFVTPDKKPFYGGTYFPPQRAHGRASWKEVLVNVSQYFSQNRNEVDAQADKLLAHMRQQSTQQPSASEHDQMALIRSKETCCLMRDKIMANADKEEGGFGMAPKFPSTFTIRFLLEHYQLFGDTEALNHALLSLDKMRMGGLFDQIGGGFARYSTDSRWIAPHFEKMLYDNALLLEVYALAYSITGKTDYLHVIKYTVDWLTREMTHAEGGFLSAIDADSEGVEGKFYTWSYGELEQLLQGDMEWFANVYHIKPEGNWEHTNILYTTYDTLTQLTDEQHQRLPAIHELLMTVRNARVRPQTDDKVLLGWNALMNKALVHCYLHTGDETYLDIAVNNMQFVLGAFADADYLYLHTWKDRQAKIPAFADDLAYLADALISLGTATATSIYYDKAAEIIRYLNTHFRSETGVHYYFVHQQAMQVMINKQETYDGATPSVNSVLCRVLRQLSELYHQPEWLDTRNKMLNAISAHLMQYPTSFSNWCIEWQIDAVDKISVTVVGPEARPWLSQLFKRRFTPNVWYCATSKFSEVPALSGMRNDDENLIYICQNMHCLPPLKDINEAFTEI